MVCHKWKIEKDSDDKKKYYGEYLQMKEEVNKLIDKAEAE